MEAEEKGTLTVAWPGKGPQVEQRPRQSGLSLSLLKQLCVKLTAFQIVKHCTKTVPGSKHHIALHLWSLLISLSFQPTAYIPGCKLDKSNLQVRALFQDMWDAELNPFALRKEEIQIAPFLGKCSNYYTIIHNKGNRAPSPFWRKPAVVAVLCSQLISACMHIKCIQRHQHQTRPPSLISELHLCYIRCKAGRLHFSH